MKPNQLNNNQITVLNLIKGKPQTHYSMSKGDAGVITGLSNMALHNMLNALEAEELIETTQSERKQIKSITKKGRRWLSEISELPFDGVPTSLSDLYVLDEVKRNYLVLEDMISKLTAMRTNADSKFLRTWITSIIERYTKD